MFHNQNRMWQYQWVCTASRPEPHLDIGGTLSTILTNTYDFILKKDQILARTLRLPGYERSEASEKRN